MYTAQYAERVLASTTFDGKVCDAMCMKWWSDDGRFSCDTYAKRFVAKSTRQTTVQICRSFFSPLLCLRLLTFFMPYVRQHLEHFIATSYVSSHAACRPSDWLCWQIVTAIERIEIGQSSDDAHTSMYGINLGFPCDEMRMKSIFFSRFLVYEIMFRHRLESVQSSRRRRRRHHQRLQQTMSFDSNSNSDLQSKRN